MVAERCMRATELEERSCKRGAATGVDVAQLGRGTFLRDTEGGRTLCEELHRKGLELQSFSVEPEAGADCGMLEEAARCKWAGVVGRRELGLRGI
jgi:hypothetical protein